MPNETLWRATWTTPEGTPREFFFSSEPSQVIARVDFQLKLLDQGQRPPNAYELEKARMGLPLIPHFDRGKEGSF